jgi:beta propeller repeat protein
LYTITNNTFDEEYPDIDGNLIVWQADEGEIFSIKGYDLISREYFDILESDNNIFLPAISNYVVVWVRFDEYPLDRNI